MLKKFCGIAFCLLIQMAHAKTLIITHAFNRPDFIELQCRTFEKFLLDDYEFVIFNDAPPGAMHDKINQICEKEGIRCFPIPQSIHNHLYPNIMPKERFIAYPSNRHADGIHYALDLIGFNHKGVVALIDSDLFLVKPLNISKLMEDCEIAAVMCPSFDNNNNNSFLGNIYYMWPGLSLMKMDKLPNKYMLDFYPGRHQGFDMDTGGHTYLYLKNNPQVRLKVLDQYFFGMNITNIRGLEIQFGYDKHFIHYGQASYEKGTIYKNQTQQYIDQKTLLIRDLIEESLENDDNIP